MIFTSPAISSAVDLIAADPDYLGHVTIGVSDVALVPITQPFVPSPELVLGDLTLLPPGAVSPDGAILQGAPDALPVVSDIGAYGLALHEPLGGFTWVGSDPDQLPLTVYGVACVLMAGSSPIELILAGLLPTPYVLNNVGQLFEASALLGFFDALVFDQFSRDVP